MLPDMDIDPERIFIIMIAECAPEDPNDYFYAGNSALFEKTTVQAFNDAGAEVSSIEDILKLGVYLTTAIKCRKKEYVIKANTIKECSKILENEISLFPNILAFMYRYQKSDQMEAALDLLPEGLNLPQPVTAALLFLKYPFSTLGPYEEAILGINCLLDDQPRFYIPHIVVNNDIPMAAGREIWGYPKKMADITYVNEVDMIWGKMERPAGHPICSWLSPSL